MSEESVKINSLVQVIKFLIIGIIYFVILYIVADVSKGQFLQNSTLVYLTNSMRTSLAAHGDNAKVMLVGGIVFLSIITGMLINDFSRKFSIISLVLWVIVSAIDFVPIKIIIEGGVI